MKLNVLNLFKIIALVFCTHLMVFSSKGDDLAKNANVVNQTTISSNDRNILREIDSDGDGDPDITDPFANNPCKFSDHRKEGSESPLWLYGDCDNDGIVCASVCLTTTIAPEWHERSGHYDFLK